MVRKERRAFTFLLILGQYLKMANSDKSNNTTIGMNISTIAKEKENFLSPSSSLY